MEAKAWVLEHFPQAYCVKNGPSPALTAWSIYLEPRPNLRIVGRSWVCEERAWEDARNTIMLEVALGG